MENYRMTRGVEYEREDSGGAVNRKCPPDTASGSYPLARVVVTKTLPRDCPTTNPVGAKSEGFWGKGVGQGTKPQFWHHKFSC